ncbi:MAG TPA: hypothetical protein VNG12_15990, partial [Acidimicrobiales bacterium]|nr:hypothetical protein [Acidimicrobiales bacterium]
MTALLETIKPGAPRGSLPVLTSKPPRGMRTVKIGRAVVLPLVWVLMVLLLLAPVACFLVIAVSPRLFDQGSQWFTLGNFSSALSGSNLQGLMNSLLVGVTSAVLAVAMGFPIAWILGRTNLAGRTAFGVGMWTILLLPSWLPALGWE